MVQRRALASIHTEDADASEALMINALVQRGEFLPLRWGVSIEDVECYQKAWQFCEDYQSLEGEAPGYGLLLKRFPDLPRIEGVGCEFAARELARDARARRLRRHMGEAASALRSGDIDQAEAVLSAIAAGRPGGKPGLSIWDAPSPKDEGPRWPTPYPTLNKAIKGIGNAELWYLAGLAGHGKTMMLCHYVSKLLMEGHRIVYLSLEVPSRTINKRVRRSLASPAELMLLDAVTEQGGPDFEAIGKAIKLQRDRVDGVLEVYDSSHGRVTPATVKYHCANADMVVVDHVGLMYTPDGRRAVDEWRLYATISNHLLEEKNASGTSILAAAQLNRGADTASENAPGTDTVGGAYQLVQDADVFITMKRLGKRAMVHSARKVREGDGPTWWSDFDVKHAKFGEITQDKAQDLKAQFPDRG